MFHPIFQIVFQMKERFGPKACLKAMMLLMQESQTETGQI